MTTLVTNAFRQSSVSGRGGPIPRSRGNPSPSPMPFGSHPFQDTSSMGQLRL